MGAGCSHAFLKPDSLGRLHVAAVFFCYVVRDHRWAGGDAIQDFVLILLISSPVASRAVTMLIGTSKATLPSWLASVSLWASTRTGKPGKSSYSVDMK